MNSEVALNALSTMIQLGRAFGNARDNEGKQPMTNWTTQLLGNRPISASAVWTLADGDEVEVNISDFIPSRNLQTGEADKGNVKAFRQAYESRGIPEDIAVTEVLKVATYLAASVATGRLPTVSQVSAESSLKGGILSEWMESTGIAPASLTIRGDGESVSYTGEAISGLLRFWRNAYDNVLDSHDAGPAAAAGASGLDWENVEVEL